MRKVFVIAEAGVNHNGDEKIASELIRIAARSGADAVKFQTFSSDKLVTRNAPKADYQSLMTGNGPQRDMLKALELSQETYFRLSNLCSEEGVEFMSTPFDEEAANMLIELGMKTIKVPSGEITNIPFLIVLAKKSLPIILSTGMANMAEIQAGVKAIKETWNKNCLTMPPDALTVLHCTSNYPTKFTDVNLRAMNSIARTLSLPIGYSDHTLGTAVSAAAVALGATVIEKHFTLDQNMDGPDHKASLNPEELSSFVANIRAIEQCLGSDIKEPTRSELPIRALVRRSVTLVKDLEVGDEINSNDIALLRPGTGISPADFDRVPGHKLKKKMSAGTTLTWHDLA